MRSGADGAFSFRDLPYGEYFLGARSSMSIRVTQTSAIDPSDDRTVWMMSVFADEDPANASNNRYRAVVAKLVP